MPAKMPARLRKTKTLTVMVRPDQWELFEIIAQSQGMNVSDWVRDVLETNADRIKKRNPKMGNDIPN